MTSCAARMAFSEGCYSERRSPPLIGTRAGHVYDAPVMYMTGEDRLDLSGLPCDSHPAILPRRLMSVTSTLYLALWSLSRVTASSPEAAMAASKPAFGQGFLHDTLYC